MRYLLGIDNGGTLSKAAVFDETGWQLAVSAERTDVVIGRQMYAPSAGL